MGIEFICHQTEHGKGYKFSFSENINKYIVGIRGFYVTYADKKQHCVKTFGINLEVSGVIKNTITVTPRINLEDRTGHRLSDKSHVDICVLAWTGTGHENVQTTSNQKFPLFLQCSDSVVASGCVLSGFELECSGDSNIIVYHTHVGTSMDVGQMGFAGSGNAEFYDKARKRGQCPWVKGSMFADCDKSSGLYVQSFSDLKYGLHEFQIPKNVRSILPMITSFTVITNRDEQSVGIQCGMYDVFVENGRCSLFCRMQYLDKNNYDEKGCGISGLLIGRYED